MKTFLDNLARLHSSASTDIWALRENAFPGVVGRADRFDGQPGAALPKTSTRGVVVTLPIFGVITQHVGDWFGDVAGEAVAQRLDALLADRMVAMVVLNIDSPGGSVYGVTELGDRIFAKRDRIIAVANSEAASAAYWLGSQAGKFYITPGGQVGSIGVWSSHVDVSRWEDMQGVKTTLIYSGEHKVDGHPYAPLSDVARADMQSKVDGYHRAFINAVARGRGRTTVDVRTGFGKGKMFRADEAKRLGMVDGVATLDDVVRIAAGDGTLKGNFAVLGTRPKTRLAKIDFDLMTM